MFPDSPAEGETTQTTETIPPIETGTEGTTAESAAAETSSTDTPPVEKKEPKQKAPRDSGILSELTAQRGKRRELESELQRTSRELEEAKVLIANLAKDPNAAAKPPQQRQQNPAIDRDLVRAEAQRIVYDQDVNRLSDHGYAEYGSAAFDSAAIRFSEGVGDAKMAMVREIMDIAGEKAHKVIYELSNDLDRALSLRGQSPAKRAIAIYEMVKMPEKSVPKEEDGAKAALASASTAKNVSKAPPPPPKIQGSATSEKPAGHWWSDKTPEDEFDRNFWASRKERRGMRR